MPFILAYSYSYNPNPFPASTDTQMDHPNTAIIDPVSDNDDESLIGTSVNYRQTIAESRSKRLTRPINRF